MKIRLTKGPFEIHAAHTLPEGFGACSNLHGHTWKLYVTVEPGWDYFGERAVGDTNLVVDFRDLKDIINRAVVSELDHKDINKELDYLVPTCENLAIWMFIRLEEELRPSLPDRPVKLYSVRLYETDTSYIEVLK